MSSSESLISRLIARVKALMSQDWHGEPGSRFRRTTRAISDFAEQHHLTSPELLDEGVQLGRRKLEGMANHEFSEAVRNYADAEQAKIETELQRRSLETDVRKKEADARKAGAEARIAELNVVAAELDLLKKLQEAGVILRQDSNGSLSVLPLPQGVSLLQLAEQRKLEAGISAPEVVRAADGIHVTKELLGSISFVDEFVIIESGALVYGDVRGANVEIRPRAAVKGNIFAKDVATLRDGARVEGDVTAKRFSIDEGAYLKGKLNIET